MNGQKYEILRYAEGKGPNFAQTIEIAKSRGKEMLTSDEARKIRYDNDLQHIAFIHELKPGAWGYTRNRESEERSYAAYLSYYAGMKGAWLGFGDYASPDNVANVVVLKETNSEARAPQSQAQANELLRTIKGQFTEL